MGIEQRISNYQRPLVQLLLASTMAEYI